MAVVAAKGTYLSIGGKKVAHLTKIGSPKVETDEVEITALDSTTGFKEWLATFKDGGEVSIEGFFDYEDEGQQALTDAMNGGEAVACVIGFPTTPAVGWTFTAFVKTFETNAELANALGFTAGLRVSGQPTLGALTA